MRCFVALPVPAAIAEELARLSVERHGLFSQARWSHPADLHVTLQFLGEIDAVQAGTVEAALRGALAQTHSLELRVTSFGVFHGAGALLAAIEPSEDLLRLTRGVSEAMRGCGFAPELRPFRPHITLARTRRSLEAETARQWIGPIEPALRLPCVEVVLYHSRGAPASAESRCEPMAAVPLRLASWKAHKD